MQIITKSLLALRESKEDLTWDIEMTWVRSPSILQDGMDDRFVQKDSKSAPAV